MRRALPLLACAAALASVVPARASAFPVRRAAGEPRVRPGVIHVRPAAAARVRVLAELPLPPLAEHYGRSLFAAGGRRRLAVHSASARAYLARVDAVQARAVAQLRAELPQARVQERFRIVLDAVTVDLPVRRLPALLRQREFSHVLPSLRYTLADDTSPGIIGADTIRSELHADGSGLKIAVVDDGIDQTNPFLAPDGLSYPAGFPKGITSATTPKVIVARVFPGPNAGRPGRLAVDPESSFHGTHVAGIAAGDEGTTAPAGADHPRVTGLSGVAPRAWLGNYRVFTVPTPIGHVANTPEIVEAFEAAVADGMDVINFSGGGPQTDPRTDALVEAVHNVAAAGVVPVIAAGNDRDDWGDGSVGSPGTAPDAISVAAVSNAHVFSPALDVVTPAAPSALKRIPFLGAAGSTAPPLWGSHTQTLADVGSIRGTNGKPVEPHLCGSAGNLTSPHGTLPKGSLRGEIALVKRGLCPFTTKAAQARAAGAVGLVVADNREGEANQIPVRLSLPAGMVSNLDGARLSAFAAAHGGRAGIRVGEDPLELATGRSGVITSFSSSGPTPFGHELKPDVAAPGGQVLSSTLPSTSDSRFAVFDGTSMATPHVAGAAALLLQLHPGWTPAQVKSALVTTAVPAWGDTARTREAAVPLEGGGLVSLPAAADPRLFVTPATLSFGDVAADRQLLLHVEDAGGGAGTWQATVAAQAATPGATADVPALVSVPPGGSVDVPLTVHVATGAPAGEDYGFVVLRTGSVTRRVPYLFLVSRPALAAAQARPLPGRVSGDSRTGTSLVAAYRFPTAPFGNTPDAPPMREDGAEAVYSFRLDRPVANAGVAVVGSSPGVRIDPFLLGAQDESSVQGFDGTPVDANPLTYDYLDPVGAAGASLPVPGRYWVAVDSGRADFSGKSLAGRYVLRSWADDVTPPSVRLLTTRVSTGRPVLAVRTLDGQAGVDPASLAIGYRGELVGASDYDPATGVATFPLPESAPALAPGGLELSLVSSDFQEAKNVDTSGTKLMPNTRTASARIVVVHGPVVDWLEPAGAACLRAGTRLLVAVGSPARVASVRVLLDGRPAAAMSRRHDRTWSARLRSMKPGRHALAAVLRDRAGRTASARVHVRSCR